MFAYSVHPSSVTKSSSENANCEHILHIRTFQWTLYVIPAAPTYVVIAVIIQWGSH